MLAAGEVTTRKFSHPLPTGWMPVLQIRPRGAVILVEHTPFGVTIGNRGQKTEPFLIHFISAETTRRVMAAREILDWGRDLLKKWKDANPDGNDAKDP